MPRNPSTGVYSKPAGTTPSVGQVIDPVPWNALTTDLGNEITNSLPRDGSAPMVAPLKASDGSVSAPGVGFASVPQTGIYLKGGTQLGFTQNGVDVSFDHDLVYAAKSADYTAIETDDNAVHRFTADAIVTLTAAATLGANWHYMVIADGGDVTIDPNASETIDGASVLIVPNGSSTTIICSGTAFYSDGVLVSSQDGFLGCVPSWVSTTSVAFSTGSGIFGGKKCTLPAYTKLISATFAPGTSSGMLDTGTVQASKTYFLFAIRNITTGKCDYLCSLNLATPTLPAGYELPSSGRVGIILTNASSQIITFTQVVNDVWIGSNGTQVVSTAGNVNPPNAIVIPNIPVGISVDAVLDFDANGTANSDVLAQWSHYYSPDAVALKIRCWGANTVNANGTAAGPAYVRTDTTAHAYLYVNRIGSGNLSAKMWGFRDWQCKRYNWSY
ncbi:hypothetical protein HFO28_07840 [Rhizobium leguminosarum]|uniref:hypothetical protein n=1 Tax=Rhizobium leguminosarum TaxID=384 RepID=UPI001C9611F7|nr:hypothetical protein [Rhizobium leguminosarum]MBY5743503.1 hypothetical protein [Rhizobium leguminosarum]